MLIFNILDLFHNFFIQIYEFFGECDFYKGIFSWYIL